MDRATLSIYHCPKTGGTAARLALDKVGLPGLIRHDHRTPAECGAGCDLEAVFIRHPVAWWRSLHSYMGYRAAKGKPVPNASRDSWWTCTYGLWLWRCRWDGSLEAFLEDAYAIDTALCSTVFQRFTQHCAFVGRTERLPDDLATVLDLAGLQYDRQLLLASPPMNMSPQTTVSVDATQRITEQDAEALALWSRLTTNQST